ncbi:MAG: HRDC domain-containing protein [Flavobacteriales bacterium]|nr:HRDC domain-containing protein [Flavobacteriales bacterium]
MIERHGKRIVAAIKAGQDLPKEQWPRLEKPKRWQRDDDYEDRLKRLKAVRDTLTARFELRPGIVAANQLLMEIARTLPGDLEALAAIPGMRRYQVENFGQELLAAL